MALHKFSPFSSHSFARLPLWTCRDCMIFESDVNTTGNTRSCCIVLDVGGSFSAVTVDHRVRSFRVRETEWRSIGVEWRASPFSKCSSVRHRLWRRNPQLLVVARLFDGSEIHGINASALPRLIFQSFEQYGDLLPSLIYLEYNRYFKKNVWLLLNLKSLHNC